MLMVMDVVRVAWVQWMGYMLSSLFRGGLGFLMSWWMISW
jgi:hypothetical protein